MIPIEFLNMVNSVEYKPGVAIKANPRDMGIEVLITAMLPCAVMRNGHKVYINFMRNASYRLIEDFDRQRAIGWLYHTCILDFEKHEAAEWFKIDGKIPFWPHEGEFPRGVQFQPPGDFL